MKFLVKGIVRSHDYFIFDSYNDYIVQGSEELEAIANVLALQSVYDLEIRNMIDIESVKPISEENAKALMKVNRTKKINDSITQVILY